MKKMVDARSCSLVLAEAPARFTSPRCFPEFPVGTMTPLACRVAPAPAAVRLAPHTMLRIVFVAVDRDMLNAQ
jgi:hypothetical protein